MKNLLAMTALALLFAGPVYADHHGGDHDKAKKFEKRDTDGDGKISKAEFLESAEKRFEKMDADGDGYIGKEEAKEKAEAWREKAKEHRGERMEKMKDKAHDHDHDEAHGDDPSEEGTE